MNSTREKPEREHNDPKPITAKCYRALLLSVKKWMLTTQQYPPFCGAPGENS